MALIDSDRELDSIDDIDVELAHRYLILQVLHQLKGISLLTCHYLLIQNVMLCSRPKKPS